MKPILAILLAAVLSASGQTNHALGKTVTADAARADYPAGNAVDGVGGDLSRWLADASPAGHWLEIDLGAATTLRQAHVYSGYQTDALSPIDSFHLESWDGSTWQPIPGASVQSNDSFATILAFTAPVTTNKIRLIVSDTAIIRVREISLWENPVPLFTGMIGSPVALNQIGFQKGAPKRFTAITCPDGTPFFISTSLSPTSLFTGSIQNGLGDFSAFEPASQGPYIVHVSPPASVTGLSDPFLILDDLIGEKYITPAVQFMKDARSGIGSHPSAFGGCPWRDGTYYSFEVPSLVHLLLTRRDAILAMPREIDWEAEKTRIASAAFTSAFKTTTNDTGFLAALRRYYANYEAPRSNAPDLVKLIHFGIGVTLERPETSDWSGDERPNQIHSQTVEWCAWVLYAWPVLREWLPDSFYTKVHDFTFAQWGVSSGLGTSTRDDDDPSSLEIDPLWYPSSYALIDKAPFKGRHAPAHSIWPNLLMYQVALREHRGDSAIYLTAARTQTQWLIDNIDWTDPKTTKGHRMSECKTMPGLAYFLRKYPADAPSGLAAKIEQWADIMIARSANGYDYRRYDDTEWSIPAGGQSWNEPGNLAGFPACALAAAWTLDASPAKQQRLREISYAAIDCLFGRNPLRAASPGRPVTLANGNPAGFPDVERGWPLLYTGSAAFLENARGALCSGPGTEHFPNNPSAALRHPEPWTNFNAAWNLSLAYMAADLDGTRETHLIPQPFTAPADSDLNHDQIPDLIQHASTGLGRPFQAPILNSGDLQVLHNLQAYDTDLTVEWTTTLEPADWHTATYNPASDIPHNDGTLTRIWQLPGGTEKLFYRLRAHRE